VSAVDRADRKATQPPPLPRLWPDTEFYWTSGADGRWRFLHCTSCRRIIHPPVPFCPRCGSDQTEVRALAGTATVWSFSVVHQHFVDWIEVPYILAIVAPTEDPEVHVTTRLVRCQPDEVAIGMPVQVTFEDYGQVFLPVFEPVEAGS
jgi:uncharacterized OB-fold protein